MSDSIHFITIDSAGTRDIDDAIYVEREGNGYRIMVAIANPTEAVPIGSTIDMAARAQAASVYARDYAVKPMLPRFISNGSGSLIAGQPRNAILFHARLDSNLSVASFHVSFGAITVAHRVSYDQIPTILASGTGASWEVLSVAAELTQKLLLARRSRGALALYDLSRMLLTDEEGNIHRYESKESTVGHIIVQELMILTNHQVALTASRNNIPILFRNHEAKVSAPPAQDLAKSLEAWLQKDDAEDAIRQLLVSVSKAQYGATLSGHYGLNLPAYMHVTSPLRRYADLVNLRQLTAFCAREPLPYDQLELSSIADELNATIERMAKERSEGFKAIVQKKAISAVRKGAAASLEDHELKQALKLTIEMGCLAEPVSEEIIRRFKEGTISDKVVDTLAIDIPAEHQPMELRLAFAKWLSENPGKSIHLLMHGKQKGSFIQIETSEEMVSEGFMAKVSLVHVDGRRVEGTGINSRKKEAGQVAAIVCLCSLLDVKPLAPKRDVSRTTEQGAPSTTATINHKGLLQEFCQKNGWAFPITTCSSQGPAHAMSFVAKMVVTIQRQKYEASSEPFRTKKEAEADAARVLLQKITFLGESASIQRARGKNPIGALQEFLQGLKQPMPDYTFTPAGTRFSCSAAVRMNGANFSGNGEGASKQEAKKKAALSVLSLIEMAMPAKVA